MVAYSCLLRYPFPWLAVLGSFLAFAHSSDFGIITIFLTSSALILCPVIVSCSKSSHQKPTLKLELLRPVQEVHETLVKSKAVEEARCQNREANVNVMAQMQEQVSEIEEESIIKKEPQIFENKKDGKGGDYLLSSSDALSDSEISLDHTTCSSEDSENYWTFRENLSHSTPCSDGSISDEESLIEITLPAGHYVDSKAVQDQSWYGFQQKWPDFRQQNWMEMLNEMNEEENLIEIDICMGSIKCSRFEIEA